MQGAECLLNNINFYNKILSELHCKVTKFYGKTQNGRIANGRIVNLLIILVLNTLKGLEGG